MKVADASLANMDAVLTGKHRPLRKTNLVGVVSGLETWSNYENQKTNYCAIFSKFRYYSAEFSKFSCCPNGQTEAKGEDFEGCEEIPIKPGGNQLQLPLQKVS